MSTYIMYFYSPPPGSNGESGCFNCFVKGDITPEQVSTVKACLLHGKYFFPSEVGLPELRPHDQPEIPGEKFRLVFLERNLSHFPDVNLGVNQMVRLFEQQKDRWGSSRREKYRTLVEVIRTLDKENSQNPERDDYTRGVHDALTAVLQRMRLSLD